MAATWLLVVAVVVGPLGLGALIASAETCGESCPCDDAHAAEDGDHAHERDGAGPHQDARGSDHHDEGQGDEDCSEDCPDDCPDCGCCSGVMVAVLSVTMPGVPAPYGSLVVPTLIEASALGAAFHVYRPPRSLT